MKHDELLAYIDHAVEKGCHDADIKELLVRHGWDPQDVHAAVDAVRKVRTPLRTTFYLRIALAVLIPVAVFFTIIALT